MNRALASRVAPSSPARSSARTRRSPWPLAFVAIPAAASLSLAPLASIAGCATGKASYRPVGKDADALIDAGRRFAFAAHAGDTGPVVADLDDEGRDAMLATLAAANEDGRASSGFSFAASLALAGSALFEGGAPPPPSNPAAAARLRARLQELFEWDRAEAAAAAAIPRRADEEVPPEDPRTRRQRTLLAAIHAKGCAPNLTSVSVRDEGLATLAPAHDLPAWDRFRERITAMHVVPLECKEHVGLVLFAIERDRPEPSWLGFQFFTNAEWATLRPQLENDLR